MKIVIIGAGRVGSALSYALESSGHIILRIISKTPGSAATLAKDIGCGYGTGMQIPDEAELVITAVNDDNLQSVLSSLQSPKDTVIAHTAGSIGLDVFDSKTVNRGVFYPLQTFTHGREYDFSGIPLFIEGSNEHTLNLLSGVASSLSKSVSEMNSDSRKYLHLAAVFSCNFVNHMFSAAEEICNKAGVSYEVLDPLVRETLEKALDMGPLNSQTGPAIRNDKKTIEKHLDLLSFSGDLKELYGVMSKSIINKYTGRIDE
ncbi:MAG TPA: Rossmann-like and DUF2520 domain-containing protein [Bacteroidales bacterium]|nr:Rossmann-like and DUF2520 domain-containing protein [Bacteroidales bacterium]